jgi:hypothetical protein
MDAPQKGAEMSKDLGLILRDEEAEREKAEQLKASQPGWLEQLAQYAPTAALVAFNFGLLLADIRAYEVLKSPAVYGRWWLALITVLFGFAFFVLYEVLWRYPYACQAQRVISFAGMVVAALFSLTMGAADYFLGQTGVDNYYLTGFTVTTLSVIAIVAGALLLSGLFAFYLIDPRILARWRLHSESEKLKDEAERAEMIRQALEAKRRQASAEAAIIREYGPDAYRIMANRLAGKRDKRRGPVASYAADTDTAEEPRPNSPRPSEGRGSSKS